MDKNKLRRHILFINKHPLNLKAISKDLGGTIEKKRLKLDDGTISQSGKILCEAASAKEGEKKRRRIYNSLKKVTPGLKRIGHGREILPGKFVCFFKSPKEIITALEIEASEILSLFNIKGKKKQMISSFIAKETINEVMIREKLVKDICSTNYHSYSNFGGWVIFDYELKGKMWFMCQKFIEGNEHIKPTVSPKSGLYMKLSDFLENNYGEIRAGIIVGLIVEAIVAISIFLYHISFRPRFELTANFKGTPLGKFLEKKKIVTPKELALQLKIEQIDAIYLLNSLVSANAMRIDDYEKKKYKLLTTSLGVPPAGAFVSSYFEKLTSSNSWRLLMEDIKTPPLNEVYSVYKSHKQIDMPKILPKRMLTKKSTIHLF